MAEALGVSIVTDPVYPYDESLPIDEVMSHITRSSIQWGSDPRITSSALSDPMVSHGASFSSIPPSPFSTGAAETSGAVVATNVPPPTTSDDSDIRRTLDHVLTVQAAQGQVLVDILDEIRGLRADLARFRSSSSLPPFDDGF